MNRNPVSQKALSLLLSFTLILSIFSLDTAGAYAAQDSRIKNSGFGATLTSQGNTLTIDSGWSNAGDISGYETVQLPGTSPTAHTTLTASGENVKIVGQSGVTYQKLTIVIKDSAKVTIKNLTIKNDPGTDDYPAVDVQSADDGNTLYLDSGSCMLQGGLYKPGIRVEGSNQITIDKEPGVADDNAAALEVSSSWYAAAIGGGNANSGIEVGDGLGCGTVNIKGGKVDAYTSQDFTPNGSGAGIGGGGGKAHGGNGGTVNITGGIVLAKSGQYGGAGIGGGAGHDSAGNGGTVSITGGKVTADGGVDGGAGIGGGVAAAISSVSGSGGTVSITGGTVTANGGEYGGAGIGGGSGPHYGLGSGSGGSGGSGGTVNITGGTVTAYGGKGGKTGSYSPACGGGAGIGGGGYTGGAGTSGSDQINISGGSVTAVGNFYGSDSSIDREGGAGIGGGGSFQNVSSSCGTICISGGARVNASAETLGTGIGVGTGNSGAANGGGTITITGGTVTAKGTGAGCEDIGGNATTNYFNGGSIDADAGKVTAPPTLTSGTAVYKTTMQLENISTETLVSCTANGSTFKSYTDANGKLYLWLPSGSPKAVVSNAGNTGTYGGTVTDGGTNILSLLSTACDITGVTVPSGAVINGTDISAQVGNGITSTTVDMTVSPNATWKLYSDQSCQTECSDKMMILNEGVNTAYIKVTAQDGKTEKIYTLAITRAGSPDANLAGLSVKANGGDVPLSPAFGANILNYTANVGSGVSEITVTPAVREPSAVFTVNGKAPAVGQTDVNITLNGAGQTTAISVKVTAQDGATAKIYTLKISREAASTPSNSSGGSSHGTPAPSLPSSLTDFPTSTTADLSSVTFPVGVTGVSLAVTPETANGTSSVPGNAGGVSDPQGAAVYHLAITQTGLNVIGSPFVYNIKLLDQKGNPITYFTGTVTVKIPVPAGIHGTPHVFRYEENTGTFADLGATVQDGYLVFTTTHFSYYVIAGTGDSVTLDTKSYQMPVGGKYQIGVKLTGGKAATVKFHSTNDKIASVAKLKNGNYQVNGKGTGTAWIMFDVYDNKNHLLTHASVRVDVKTGIRPRGGSTRQIGVF